MAHALIPDDVPASPPATGPVSRRRLGAGRARLSLALTMSLAVVAGMLMALTAPAQAATSTGLLNFRAAVVKLTNAERATKGCKPLKVAKKLTNAAQGHANDMSAKNYFSHTSKDGTPWDKRILRSGWKHPGGENIAYGFTSAAAVLTGWMNSPGHRRNIMDCSFDYIGIGYASKGRFWVQNFGYAPPTKTTKTATKVAAKSAPTTLQKKRVAVVRVTNAKRAAKGCKPLKVAKKLNKAAQGHAKDMSAKNYFSHTSKDGTPWHLRITRKGWSRPGGENIAYGFGSPKGVVRGWMNSPGHRRNILDCNFRYIGVGFKAKGKFWVQNFGY